MSERRTGGRRSKVARVIDEYDLEGMGERLADEWTGEAGERRSLRALADLFNREVLAAAMREAGLRPLDGEVENMYRLLTDDEVGGGQRAEAEAQLEREGIDPADLREDFVSHQAVHTFLTKHRSVEPPTDREDRDRARSALETVQRTKGRLRSVTEGTIEDLRSAGELTVGDVDVLVSAQVYCEDCGRQFEVAELLERGGCDCE